MEVYKTTISSLDHLLHMDINMNKVDKNVLVATRNPKYHVVLEQYAHLAGMKMNYHDQKQQLSIHMVSGASDYSKINIATKPRTVQQGEPVVELTKFVWTVMSHGKELNIKKMLLNSQSYLQL